MSIIHSFFAVSFEKDIAMQTNGHSVPAIHAATVGA
jgi:hypothetical protein